MKHLHAWNVVKRYEIDEHSDHLVSRILSVVFYTLLLLYSVFAFYLHFARPTVTTSSQEMLTSLGINDITINVQTACSAATWQCTFNATKTGGGYGEGAAKWEWEAGPLLFTRYSGSDSTTIALKSTPPLFFSEGHTLPLKPSKEGTDGIFLTAPGFTTTCAYGSGCTPSLATKISAGKEKMSFEVSLEPHQRKAVYIGVLVDRKMDMEALQFYSGSSQTPPDISYELFRQDLFYEGKNSNTTASLHIALSQFAQVSTTTRPGSILLPFSSIGGFASAMLALFKMISTSAECLFRKQFAVTPSEGLKDNENEDESTWVTPR